MAKIYDNITATIGNTPLVRLNRLTSGAGATVLAKLASRTGSGLQCSMRLRSRG
jgi:cysteine synthase